MLLNEYEILFIKYSLQRDLCFTAFKLLIFLLKLLYHKMYSRNR